MSQHLVQFYENDAFLNEEVLNFLSSGLWAGDAAIVIAAKPRLQYLEKRLRLNSLLGAINPNPDDPGYYTFHDAEETLSTFMIDGWPNEPRFVEVIGNMIEHASQQGNRRVRVFGEMVALLWADGKQDVAMRVEELWNVVAERRHFTLLCAYPMSSFAGEEHGTPFHEVCAAHSRVRPAENYQEYGGQDALYRNIAKLQQKTKAMESEVKRRRKIELMLSEREKELSDFLENAVVGLHRLAPDGRIAWANKFELDLLGYLPDEYIGRQVTDFHLDRQAMGAMLERVFKGETVYDFPAQLRCKDGSIKHVLIHSNAHFEDGNCIFARCFLRDITDHVRLKEEKRRRMEDKRTEKMLRAAQDELENRVLERTAKLARSNALLVAEIAERRRAERALQQSQRLLRELALHTEGVVESERKRIARELHDELGQNLMALRIDVLLMNEEAGEARPQLAACVNSALTNIDATIKNVRAIINDLRPAVLDLGLYAAIEWAVREFERRSGIECKLNADHHEFNLDDARAIALFRILQESLNNVIRHAYANQVEISLQCDGNAICMRIADDGVGDFPGCRRKANAFGLVGIRERVSALGGELTIDTDKGMGMALTVVLPV